MIKLNKISLKSYLLDSSYYLAISLYEQLEEIEKIVDEKINLVTKQILDFTNLVNEIKNITSSEYENLYNQIKNNLKEKYLLKILIDNNDYEICVHILNDFI